MEHTYSKFYSKLCSTIVKIDLESQGKKAIPGNLKFCVFRKKLLDYCRGCFEEIFKRKEFEDLKAEAEAAGKTYSMADFRDEQMKRQHKLFGNIEFIGELYTCFLLRGDTARSIFEHLLHPDCFLDDTVEAAIKFIEKIGPSIEEKLTSGGSGSAQRKISQEDYDGILTRFRNILSASEAAEEGVRICGKRIQKLLLNMLENQQSGWKKLKSKDKDIKTKREVEIEEIKKAQAAEANRAGTREDDGNRGGGRNNRGDNRRDERRDGDKHQYVKKQSSVISQQSDQGRGGNNRGRRNTQGKGGNEN